MAYRTYQEAVTAFWQRAAKTDGCWIWIAGKNGNGYGNFRCRFFPNSVLAHRISWFIKNGPMPDDINVLHHCDNPACVRPDHLFLGTQRDNISDMMRKGRNAHPRSAIYLPRGEAHHFASAGPKLTRAIAEQIRQDDRPQKVIAAQYGVSPSMISRIKTGTTWRRPHSTRP